MKLLIKWFAGDLSLSCITNAQAWFVSLRKQWLNHKNCCTKISRTAVSTGMYINLYNEPFVKTNTKCGQKISRFFHLTTFKVHFTPIPWSCKAPYCAGILLPPRVLPSLHFPSDKDTCPPAVQSLILPMSLSHRSPFQAAVKAVPVSAALPALSM